MKTLFAVALATIGLTTSSMTIAVVCCIAVLVLIARDPSHKASN